MLDLKVMRYIIVILLLSSCSAANLLSRAIKKDPSIRTTDTLYVDKVIEKEVGIVTGIDSIEVDNDKLWIKAIGSGKLTLSYEIKEHTITIPVEVPKITPPKTRQDHKTERARIKSTQKTARAVAKSTQKLEQTKARKSYNKNSKKRIKWYEWMILGAIIWQAVRSLASIMMKKFFI